MNNSFHIAVDVNVSLTPALTALLQSFLGMQAEPAVAVQEPKAIEKPKPAEEPKTESKADKAIEQLTEKLDLEPVETVEKPAEYVRAAMAACRTRIEGEGYTKESPFHKELTTEFKKIANLLGSEKPSELPADKAVDFAHALDDLVIEDGKLITKLPY